MTDQPTTLRVTEVYRSIQGESSWAGLSCTFIRLTGCPLRCSWCDSEYTFTGGTNRSLEDILNEVRSLNCNLVEVTGGEPLAQKNSLPLMRKLCDEGYTVLLETAGALSTEGVDSRVHVIMDLKTPSSGETDRNDYSNINRLSPERDEIKFVVEDKADFDWAASKISELNLIGKAKSLLMSPVFGKLDSNELSNWIMSAGESSKNMRLQIQLHKHIWGPERKGV